ncbi:hypothetical protein [Aquimarina longa]|uniref:hypothetical protein n=1 Tax=Aquimarina longa TaxID=1080221 RepID=UPI000AD9FAA8|nr:hypothetical protein [Aquimarina longa]
MRNIQVSGSNEELKKVIAFCKKNKISYSITNQKMEDFEFPKTNFKDVKNQSE